MSTTATTPSELYISIDTTIRGQVEPNSITPESHSDLLYNMVEVLSGGSSTNVGEIKSYSEVVSLSADTPTQITHNLNNENLIVQTWDSFDDLVDLSVSKYSADTSNVLLVETTVSETFRINVLSLTGATNTNNIVNTLIGLTANTPLQILHNLDNENIIVQTWLETTGENIELGITKFTGDTNNVLIVESTVSELFRINIIGL